ncbi:CaiB/BaiF CoA transferase family protein [Leisingera methylohalidivorans]|uniref:Acyl-CoA transferase n=1 Tax=Leisingera methylohalidivorans DSM 14336 TaxID=999552 RepID=V9VTX5_9RHOB|nr:CoA transferase [Leisingera methylohalidivorans]AHD02206.1 acyl-CoA transferase [Leisingera methylohalidivorans DSM 14336]
MFDNDETAGRRPLNGVRVLDFSRVLAGPYCTALMADLGAEVIKVEPPAGDDYRHIGPFKDGESLLFHSVNRGKKSIVLDLKSAEGAAAARALAAESDVLIENFRPGVMERFRLGAKDLCAACPQLVYVSVSGFGQTGPNRMLPAYDIIIQAMSGLMDVTGAEDGPPMMAGDAFADVAGGMFAAFGAMVALFDRARSGRGRHVDLALYDSLVSMMPVLACRALMAGETPRRTGSKHALSAPFGTYPAKDGSFTVAVLNDRLFAKFAAAIGAPELATDLRFASDSLRRQNEPALARHIESWAAARDVQSVVAVLSEEGIPAAALCSVPEAWTSPQAQARELATPVIHPSLGALSVPEQPVHFSGAPRGGRQAAPELGAHTDEILKQLQEGETK